jgi:hypothetical protein
MKKLFAILCSAILILTFTPPPVGNVRLGVSVADAKQIKRGGRNQIKRKGRPSAGRPNRPNRPNKPNRPNRPNKPGKPNRPHRPPHHGGHHDKHHHHRYNHRKWNRYGAGVITGLAIGAIISSLPPNCREIYVRGIAYQQCGPNWYLPTYQGSRIVYQVVAAPR